MPSRLAVFVGVLLGIPLIWLLIALYFVNPIESPTTFTAIMVSAIAAGIFAAVLQLQRLAGKKMDQVGSKLVILCGVVIPVAALVLNWTAIGIAAAKTSLRWPAAATTAAAVADVPPPPLTEEEREEILDQWLPAIQAQAANWEDSPTKVEKTFDLEADREVFLINMTFMGTYTSQREGVKGIHTMQITQTHGSKHYAAVQNQEDVEISEEADLVTIKRLAGWEADITGSVKESQWTLKHRPDTIVFRKEATIEGGALEWGTIFVTSPKTGRPLKVDLWIFVLGIDKDGQPYWVPQERFNNAPPIVHLVDPTTGASDKFSLRDWKKKLNQNSQGMGNGKQLWIKIPPEFGKVRMFVNVRIQSHEIN